MRQEWSYRRNDQKLVFVRTWGPRNVNGTRDPSCDLEESVTRGKKGVSEYYVTVEQ